MILRIVKIKIDEVKIDTFKLFMKNLRNEKLRLKGCLHFDYFHEKKNKNIYYTYTIWENEKHLNQYKKSELFKKVISTLNSLSIEEPRAWTIEDAFNYINYDKE